MVATDCPSGPREIVRDGVDGILVPVDDNAALSRALSELMGDGDRRRRLGRAGQDAVRRYNLPAVSAQWKSVIMTLLR